MRVSACSIALRALFRDEEGRESVSTACQTSRISYGVTVAKSLGSVPFYGLAVLVYYGCPCDSASGSV